MDPTIWPPARNSQLDADRIEAASPQPMQPVSRRQALGMATAAVLEVAAPEANAAEGKERQTASRSGPALAANQEASAATTGTGPRAVVHLEFEDRQEFIQCPPELLRAATRVSLNRVHRDALRTPHSALTYVRSARSEGLHGEIQKDGVFWIPLYDRSPINVQQFGAAGNGVADDILALEAARDFALEFGGQIAFPAGSYRITRTFRIGPARWKSYDALLKRTQYPTSTFLATIETPENLHLNYRLMGIGLVALGAVNIIADFSADRLTPVIEYNVSRNMGSAAIEGPFRVIPPALFDGRRYARSSSYRPDHNLIGWALAGHALKRVQGIAANGMEVGVAAVALYWSSLSDLQFESCGDCLNLPGCNAITVRNIDMWYSRRGVIFDGAASYLGQLHTQQVAEELTVLFAECCDIEDCYFEDGSSARADFTYAVNLGQGFNIPSRVIATQLRSVRVGSRRPGKRSFNISGATGLSLTGCREYSGGVDADLVSSGTLQGTDFALSSRLPAERFKRL